MKKKLLTSVIGITLLLTACGEQAEVTEIPAETASEEESVAEQVQESDVSVNETADNNYITDDIISTDLITVTIPDELKGTTYANIVDDRIEIYDKAVVDSGFPGFVFSIGVSPDCTVYAGGMYVKQGEIFASDGKIYNVGKGYASEIQWDYNEPDMPESYKKIYDSSDSIIANIQGVGQNMFSYKAGTKGEDLYFTVLDKYVTAINEGWDASKLEEEGMSPEIAVIVSNSDKPFENIGYAYVDINTDGIDDLFIGDISGGELDGAVYDIYTMVERVATHVVSGTARNRYYGYANYAILNEYSGGAAENGYIISTLTPNDTELFCQVAYKYDANENAESPWFTAYNDMKWEAMTEDDFNAAMDRVKEGKMTLEYTPLAYVAGIDFSKADMSKYDTFTQIVDSLYPGMAYANVTIDETDVLLVASGSYDNLDGNQAAIDSSAFCYDKDGKIIFLGQVQSQGTANPLAIKDGKLLVAGHHFVTKYEVKDGKLSELITAYEEYDEAGNSKYFYGTEAGKGYEQVSDDTKLQEFFKDYSEAEIINYQEVVK
ncbi:hypothetical protein [Butyrivibrio sp. YAB3001]|uniref:hypothetical protein n=1 Tax=Butyrivibrio sp. YAB3001 TaxID=1520812 RepID=UPI0008F61F94|nr:hypothetical protein [Butyrivibrio sp. YAB3001]SFC48921.1 hypothetical protein SAMN02910398_02381 [Butyrivibrio sp. YAB3001]